VGRRLPASAIGRADGLVHGELAATGFFLARNREIITHLAPAVALTRVLTAVFIFVAPRAPGEATLVIATSRPRAALSHEATLVELVAGAAAAGFWLARNPVMTLWAAVLAAVAQTRVVTAVFIGVAPGAPVEATSPIATSIPIAALLAHVARVVELGAGVAGARASSRLGGAHPVAAGRRVAALVVPAARVAEREPALPVFGAQLVFARDAPARPAEAEPRPRPAALRVVRLVRVGALPIAAGMVVAGVAVARAGGAVRLVRVGALPIAADMIVAGVAVARAGGAIGFVPRAAHVVLADQALVAGVGGLDAADGPGSGGAGAHPAAQAPTGLAVAVAGARRPPDELGLTAVPHAPQPLDAAYAVGPGGAAAVVTIMAVAEAQAGPTLVVVETHFVPDAWGAT
jgi:hypothetical protein